MFSGDKGGGVLDVVVRVLEDERGVSSPSLLRRFSITTNEKKPTEKEQN